MKKKGQYPIRKATAPNAPRACYELEGLKLVECGYGTKGIPQRWSDDEWAFVAPYLTLMTEDAKRRKGSKVHVAVDTLGYLLAVRVTPANEVDRAQVEHLAQAKRGFVLLPRRWV